MNFKLLALDIDGTLIPRFDAEPSEKVKEAIAQVRSSGVYVVLCTGKSYINAQRIIDIFGLNDSYVIVESGAKIIGPENKIIYSKLLDHDEVMQIYQEVKSLSVSNMICLNGQWAPADTPINSQDEITTLSMESHSKDQTKNILNKLDSMGLKDRFNYNAATHWTLKDGAGILLTNKEASKFHAMEFLKKLLNIQTSEVIAIGDMSNDIPMLNAAGFKVAMGNGNGEIKSIADYIAPSVEDDGVIEIIEKFVLNNV